MTGLVLAGSLRRQSFNLVLANIVARHLATRGFDVQVARLAEFDAPLYNQDLLDGSGFPATVQAFTRQLRRADAFAIASPEYVFSIPGPLKNLIDWSSQEEPIAWAAKPGLLVSTSVSRAGGERGLWALRVPLEALGARLYPEMFSLPEGHQALDRDGRITEASLDKRLENIITGFAAFAAALSR